MMSRAWMLFLATALSVVAAACSQQGESLSRTEEARRKADPRGLEYLVRAQQTFEGGFYTNALLLVDSAAQYLHGLADVPFLRGRIFTAMRQYGQAQDAYEATLDLDPDYPGVYLNLGNSAYLRGAPQEALALYRKEKGAANTSAYLVQLGRAYSDLGVTDSARWAYERAIAAEPDNPTAYMWLGQTYEDAGDFDRALQYSRKGLALRPDNLNYRYVVGVQLLRSGDLPAAAAMLRQAADGMPWHYAAHYNLGQALSGLGQAGEADRYLVRADTLLERKKETTKWEKLVEANSHEPLLWVNYGNSLRKADRYDDAIEAYTVAHSLRPEWMELQNNIANLLLLRGDTAAAVQRYEALLRMNPTQPDLWLNLGTVHALSGHYADARAAWQTALRYDPNHQEAARYLAQLP